MVPPSSDRIARVPPYSRTLVPVSRTGLSPAAARLSRRFRYQKPSATGLFRVRSPLLTESRLMSVPPATEMFQFAGFASSPYEFSTRIPVTGWVAPFGDPGITDRSHLPRAFRSVPRPSSPLSAKASTRCPYLRLITGASPRKDASITAAHRGKTPLGQTLRISGSRTPINAAASHEDTSSDTTTAAAAPGLSASVTSQTLSSPFNQHPAPGICPRNGSLSSPTSCAHRASHAHRWCEVRRWWR